MLYSFLIYTYYSNIVTYIDLNWYCITALLSRLSNYMCYIDVLSGYQPTQIESTLKEHSSKPNIIYFTCQHNSPFKQFQMNSRTLIPTYSYSDGFRVQIQEFQPRFSVAERFLGHLRTMDVGQVEPRLSTWHLVLGIDFWMSPNQASRRHHFIQGQETSVDV